jgi:FKBP-type peptidyl-prolyl cis-trans isomerase (trigger factor)
VAKEAKKSQQKPSLEAFQEEVRKSAEEIYKKRTADNKPGDALSDWLKAEKEIKKKYGL